MYVCSSPSLGGLRKDVWSWEVWGVKLCVLGGRWRGGWEGGREWGFSNLSPDCLPFRPGHQAPSFWVIVSLSGQVIRPHHFEWLSPFQARSSGPISLSDCLPFRPGHQAPSLWVIVSLSGQVIRLHHFEWLSPFQARSSGPIILSDCLPFRPGHQAPSLWVIWASELFQDPVTDEYVWYYPFRRQCIKFCFSFSILIMMVSAVWNSMYIAVTHALYGALVSVSVFVIIMNVDSCFQMALVLVIMTAIITY